MIHDYLTQRGGAERLVLSMLRAFPDATLVTGIYNPATTFPEFAEHHVETLWPSRVRLFREHHRRALPVLAAAFSSVRTDEELLCSSSGWAHGATSTKRKVVYCYTPARWLYSPESFASSRGTARALSLALKAVGGPLRAWDQRAAATAHTYLTSSRAVASRISAVYGREAEVLPPPMLLPRHPTTTPLGLPSRYALVVSRLLPYKNVDEAIAACDEVDIPLVVVGSGPDSRRLQALAGPSVTFLNGLSEHQMDSAYAGAAVLIAPAHEDYGLTPLEAAARGVPVVALAEGGYLDTVVDDETGLLYEEGNLVKALLKVLDRTWDRTTLEAHAATHNEARFIERLRSHFAVPSAPAP